jgi:hypothetical protein
MAKGAYPDQLCMIGRVGHFEDAVNGVYVRVRGEAKKEEVRLFYEKTDGVVLCYGSAAWKESEAPEKEAAEEEAEKKKPIKGWMIGWYQDIRECDAGESGETKRLFIAARCQMGGDPGAQNFLWEVRDEEGDFVKDEATQLVLLPDKPEENDAPSPGRVTLRLADEVSLHPTGSSPTGEPMSTTSMSDRFRAAAAGSPLNAASPFGYPPIPPFGSPFGMPMPGFFDPFAAPSPMNFGQYDTGATGKKKKKKGKKGANDAPASPSAAGASAGLRADAPAFIPGAAMMPPPFPFMPYPPPQDFMARAGMMNGMRSQMGAAPMVSINKKYLAEGEEPEQEEVVVPEAPPQPAAPPAAAASPAKTVNPDGLASTNTRVEWQLKAVTDKILACSKGEGVKSSEFTVKKDGVSGPPMQLTVYPYGHPMSPSGCVAVMLECSAGARMKFKVFAGSQKSGPKVLMGNRFHVDFAGNSVFGSDDTSPEAVKKNFEELEVGLELLDWM